MHPNRIQWACRRGMLELDLFFLPFFERHFDSLHSEEQEAFILLLEEADPDLFQWLMGYQEAPSKHQAIVHKILECHHT